MSEEESDVLKEPAVPLSSARRWTLGAPFFILRRKIRFISALSWRKQNKYHWFPTQVVIGDLA